VLSNNVNDWQQLFTLSVYIANLQLYDPGSRKWCNLVFQGHTIF